MIRSSSSMRGLGVAVLLNVWSCDGDPGAGAHPARGLGNGAPPDSQTSQRAAAAVPVRDLGDIVERTGEVSAWFNRADWDVATKAAELAAGVDPAFAFVRDHIAYEPYAGVLRGADGTYASRAGNAVDRALLLARLLDAKGIRTRFAVGTLAHEDRERLFLHTFHRGPTGAAGEERRLGDGARLHNRLFRRARQDYEAVRSALGPTLPPVISPSRPAVLAEMNPHVWVQAEVDGRWIDLDPAFTDAEPGRQVAELDETVEHLPENHFQQVTIRVVAEHLNAGVPAASTLLEVTRNAVDLLDTQILVVHQQPAAAAGLGSAIASALGQSIGDHWAPLLWIAGDVTPGTAVNIAAGQFVGEWLEFELTWPGGRRETTRRALLDRGGPAWRAAAQPDPSALRPVPRDESGALAMQAVHNVWLSGGGHHLADFADATLLMFVDEATKALTANDSLTTDLGREAWPFILQNFGAMVLTDHVILPLLNDQPGARLYPDGPRISIFTTGPVGDGKFANGVDLRRDDLRGLALDPSKALLVADLKLRFGMLQGALEHELMAELTAMGTGDTAGVRSTSSLLADKRLTALAPGAPVPDGGDDATVALRAAVSSGRVVVASSDLAGGGTQAWWEVLPGTGDTRAIGDFGLHGARTPGMPHKDLFKINKARTQQNAFDGQKEWDGRTPKEKAFDRGAARRAEIIERNRVNPGRHNNLAQPQQGEARGGGSEYAILLTIGTIAKVAVYVLSQVMLAKLFEEIELLCSWLADGGFQAGWP